MGEASKNLYNLLEFIYLEYNKRNFVHPDPLEFLYNYEDSEDVELVGLISSSLALGRVEKILEAIEKILTPLGKSPSKKLKTLSQTDLSKIYENFVYRFFKTDDIVNLLITIKKVKEKNGTIENLFYGIYKNNKNFISSLDDLVNEMEIINLKEFGLLLPKPSKGSACKRLFLFLRWMIRKDEVDLGIWEKFNKSQLLLPMDTHMLDISSKLFDLRKEKSASLKKAIEVTNHFSKINKDDPVKYDFSLTRFGINRNLNKKELFFEILNIKN